MSRPRSIPEDVAVERALLLFWEHGYDRTSIADLSEAIGLGPSSIYNAFGSKEDLFRRAIGRYVETYAGATMKKLASDDGEEAVEFVRKLMRGLVKLYTTKGLPTGCAIFQSGGSGAPSDSQACAITQQINGGLEQALRQRFRAFADRGEELTASPRTLAQFIVGVLRGVSQLASDGASRADLMKVVDHAAKSCVVGGQP
ncbi:MAG: TetR/AcrR family transcriptional regulator [Acidobacteria bacterium]|nr:TetR/AcrR family transcriptional regulator [Acidobacteriota bacterium]MDA1234541.1 TetR/AcrR family transcriptional regulator [Acidobacteriota bacterium]